jgi:hypothetical protein
MVTATVYTTHLHFYSELAHIFNFNNYSQIVEGLSDHRAQLAACSASPEAKCLEAASRNWKPSFMG